MKLDNLTTIEQIEAFLASSDNGVNLRNERASANLSLVSRRK